MASSKHAAIVGQLKTAVEATLQETKEYGQTDDAAAEVVDAIRFILEHGLEGNRSVRPFIWNVVRRIGRAYPVTFHSSIDKVRALSRVDSFGREQIENAWIRQAIHEGVLSTFIKNVMGQFQIRSAYLSEAVICDASWRGIIVKLVDELKGLVEPVPDAPSVSSWSSDDSFIHTPRSSRVDETQSPAGARPNIKEEVEIKNESGAASEDDHERIAPSSETDGRRQKNGKPPRSTGRGVSTANSDKEGDQRQGHGHSLNQSPKEPSSEETRPARPESEETPETKTKDRPSLLGRTTRTLSGRLYHTFINEGGQSQGLTSSLSLEERTSRFWSRRKSGSSASLLKEVEKDIVVESMTSITPEERIRASQMLVREINKSVRIVLQQHCATGVALKVNAYPLSVVLPLYADAFAVGLRSAPLFHSNVPGMYLSDFEKIVPEKDLSPLAVLCGMQKIYREQNFGIDDLASDVAEDDGLRLQEWLKDSLLERSLAQRIEMILTRQKFLEGWYYPEAIVMNEDLVAEIIASCRSLNTINIEGAQKLPPIPVLASLERPPSASLNIARIYLCRVTVVLHCLEDSSPEVLSPNGTDTRVSISSTGTPGEQEWIDHLVHMSPGGSRREMGSPCLSPQSDLVTPTSQDDINRMQRHHSFHAASSSKSPPPASRRHVSRKRGEISSESDKELPAYQQISRASAQMGKLRVGDASRISGGGSVRSTSVRSTCFSGEGGEDWGGVWKDVDVVRHEIRTSSQGEAYVIYVIELMASDGTHWQTARRFSDLVALSKALLKQNVELPHSWTNLQKARNVSGKRKYATEIVEARQALIRQCLWDLMATYPESLIWTAIAEFLDAPMSLLRGTKPRKQGSERADERVRSMVYDRINNHLGKLVLIVDLPVQISDEVLFEIQKGLCAGCQSFLPSLTQQRSLFSKSTYPRKCQYTELLYCHKCHRLDTAYLPSRVLHCWDFDKYSVSIGAKSYLYSTFLSPVLCISAVNPGLLASVPVLAHLEHLRQNIVRQMDTLKAKGRDGKRIALAIEENAGENKHLLQNADHWSMKDLGDISRGVFARLPRWLEAVNKQIGKLVESHCT